MANKEKQNVRSFVSLIIKKVHKQLLAFQVPLDEVPWIFILSREELGHVVPFSTIKKNVEVEHFSTVLRCLC